MAPLPSVPNTAHVRVFMDQSTHTSQNGFYVRWSSGTADNADMVDLATNIWTAYAAMFNDVGTGGHAYISDDTSLIKVTATDLSSDTAPFGSFDNGGVAIPGVASQKSINNSALVISRPVARRYRGGHSRFYVPGITGDNTDDGRTWKDPLPADFYTWVTTVLGPTVVGGSYPNIGGLGFVEVSYISQTENPVPPHHRALPRVDPTAQAAWKIDRVIRSQRRRVRNTPTPT